MTPTAHALLAYTAWFLLLVVALGGFRSFLVVSGGKAVNGFSPSGEDVEGFGRRLTRVHANCYENLPAAAAVLLYAIATSQTSITDPLANVLLGARLLQSIVHLVSTSRPAVLLRFGFFVVQVLILLYWILRLAHLL